MCDRCRWAASGGFPGLTSLYTALLDTPAPINPGALYLLQGTGQLDLTYNNTLCSEFLYTLCRWAASGGFPGLASLYTALLDTLTPSKPRALYLLQGTGQLNPYTAIG